MRDCDCGAVKREKSWYCFTLNFGVLALYLLYFTAFHPAPPGLLAHPRVPGGLMTPPAISRTVGRRESCEAAFESSPQDSSEALK